MNDVVTSAVSLTVALIESFLSVICPVQAPRRRALLNTTSRDGLQSIKLAMKNKCLCVWTLASCDTSYSSRSQSHMEVWEFATPSVPGCDGWWGANTGSFCATVDHHLFLTKKGGVEGCVEKRRSSWKAHPSINFFFFEKNIQEDVTWLHN